jgi:hypothetical protein
MGYLSSGIHYEADYARAVVSDRRLSVIERMVDTLVRRVRPADEFCYGCYSEHPMAR